MKSRFTPVAILATIGLGFAALLYLTPIESDDPTYWSIRNQDWQVGDVVVKSDSILITELDSMMVMRVLTSAALKRTIGQCELNKNHWRVRFLVPGISSKRNLLAWFESHTPKNNHDGPNGWPKESYTHECNFLESNGDVVACLKWDYNNTLGPIVQESPWPANPELRKEFPDAGKNLLVQPTQF